MLQVEQDKLQQVEEVEDKPQVEGMLPLEAGMLQVVDKLAGPDRVLLQEEEALFHLPLRRRIAAVRNPSFSLCFFYIICQTLVEKKTNIILCRNYAG